MNIARVFSQQERLERVQNRSEARSKKALTETGDGFVGLDADKGPIEISFHDRSLEANDFQRRSLYLLTAATTRGSKHPWQEFLLDSKSAPSIHAIWPGFAAS